MSSAVAAPSTPAPPPPSTPVPLVIVALQNQLSLPLTVTPPSSGTAAPPISVFPGGSLDLGPGPAGLAIPLIPPATPPTAATAISIVAGTSAPVLLYTDGTGQAFLSNVSGGTPQTIARMSPPDAITLQLAPDTTPGNFTAAGIVAIYNITFI